MSDSEEEQKEVIEPVPENKIRYTDLNDNIVEKFIRLIDKAIKDNAKAQDKELAKVIQQIFAGDPDTIDEAAGWHCICGKSFASAITFQTKNVLFFDLLGDTHKTFLIFKTSEQPKAGQMKK